LLIKVADAVGSEDYSLYGQEINGGTWALAKMNLFLHEKDNARIEWGDVLNDPKLLEDEQLMKFDVVVANPPFSLNKWGAENAESDPYDRFWRGVPPKSKADFAFITHMIESTVKDSGKVGVIVPHGVLFRGSKEGLIRKQLIEEGLLEAVIGLPEKLFFGTGIPAAILVFNRGKQSNDVLFIDASREYQEGTRQNRLRQEDLKKIVETYRNFRDDPEELDEAGKELVEKYAYQATLPEIRENEYNLNIPRYVDTFEEEEPVDIAETQKEIEQIEAELTETRKKMDEYLKELGYK
jgi:type I restriction enzyme M protein